MTSRILDNFRTQEMCDKEVEKDLWSLAEVPDHKQSSRKRSVSIAGSAKSLKDSRNV